MAGNLEELRNTIQPLLVGLEKDLEYTAPAVGDDLRELTKVMYAQAVRTGVPFPEGSGSRKAFTTGLAYGYFCYPHHPLEVRAYVGIYTWLAIIVDDNANKDPEQWALFIFRYHTGRRQHNVVAREFAKCLRLAYRYFDPIVANFAITATLNFVNATVLEGAEVPKLKPTAGGQSWPYYLRDKNGVAEAYVWFTFPKAANPDISLFMEAVPDMSKYIVFVNDIYSFYKEEIARDKDNYMYARAAYVEGESVYEVYQEVVAESVAAHRRILEVLKDRPAYERAWRAHAIGYAAFHKNSSRYRLDDMGLAESRFYRELMGHISAVQKAA
ncbi:terpenoid synthase [Xylariaceae sp. FL0594]|nr:terpenoid synthase [Xylariaceae sp. FL0594]